MLNTAKTSMSSCHVRFININKAGKMHKLELICIFMGVFCIDSQYQWDKRKRNSPCYRKG